MLSPQLRSQFVTKVLTSPTGEKFRVVFLVAVVNGEVKAQVVSATPISAKTVTVPCLPEAKIKSPVSFTYTPTFTEKLSLFNELFFFNSQPTRAPSFK
jgi:hypothetical protein